MKIQNDDDGAVLNCAVRYALGRSTYMPHIVCSVIIPLLPDCTIKTLWCFRRDVEQYLAESKISPVDCGEWRLWEIFLADVTEEIRRRT